MSAIYVAGTVPSAVSAIHSSVSKCPSELKPALGLVLRVNCGVRRWGELTQGQAARGSFHGEIQTHIT